MFRAEGVEVGGQVHAHKLSETLTPWTGYISFTYRCAACGHEIGIAKGHKLPPQNHHQHAPGIGRIQWQLLVYAQSR